MKNMFVSNQIGQWKEYPEYIPEYTQEQLYEIVLNERIDERKKIKAIKQLYDEDYRCKVVINGINNQMRLFTLNGIYKPESLKRILYKSRSPTVRRKIIKRIKDEKVLVDIAINDYDNVLRRKAFRMIEDEDNITRVLVETRKPLVPYRIFNSFNHSNCLKIVCYSSYSLIRRECMRQISSQEDYEYICIHGQYIDMIFQATNKLNKQKSLKNVLYNSSNYYTRQTIIRKIENKKILEYFAENDEDEIVKKTARMRLKKM